MSDKELLERIEFRKILLEWKLSFIKMSNAMPMNKERVQMINSNDNIFGDYICHCEQSHNYYKNKLSEQNKNCEQIMNFHNILKNGNILSLIYVPEPGDYNLHDFIYSLIIK